MITHLPDVLRRGALKLLPYVTPAAVHGPALFFLSALGMEMVGKTYGSKRVADHFAELIDAKPTKPTAKGTSPLKTRSAS